MGSPPKKEAAKKEQPKPPEIPLPVAPTRHEINPAYTEAKKYEGKKETDSKFGAWLSAFWAKVGLKNYKTIIGTTFAWCGLFVFAMNTQVGQKAVSDAAAAVSWMKYGQAIDWKANGIPKSAVVQINHNGKCGSSSGNHVTFADGDCSAADLAKPNATFPGFGGNQSDQVKRSNYSVKEICRVAWPSEMPLPGKIEKSVNCASGGTNNETTR